MIEEPRVSVSSISEGRTDQIGRTSGLLSTAGPAGWSVAAGPELAVVEINPYVVAVEVGGEHDIGFAHETNRLLLRLVDAYDAVIVDLSAALFIDSSFLLNLENAAQAARERGTRFRVHLGAASSHIRRVIELGAAFQASITAGNETTLSLIAERSPVSVTPLAAPVLGTVA